LIRFIFAVSAAAIALPATQAANNSMFNPDVTDRVIKLSGNWRFSIGDDPAWADPEFDDKGWSRVRAPDQWEDQGYENYNGFAWYRTTFKFPTNRGTDGMFLALGQIDDADQVFVNGVEVGQTGQFPPAYVSAYSETRAYLIPGNVLKPGERNTVTVRVYDGGGVGGLVSGTIGIYKAYFPKMAINLSGTWKFHPGDNMGWAAEDADDSEFVSIPVPGTWADAGFGELDGFGWYRTKFAFNGESKDETLVLMLGQIDDLDEVYLNGERIGGMGDMTNPARETGVAFYRELRGYYFPVSLLKEENVLAVRVYDQRLTGGIYSGPVGIASQSAYVAYWEKRRENSGVMKEILNNM
jgi:sialate O-acetylesterase